MDIERLDQPILLRNTLAYEAAHANAFEHAVREAVLFAKKHAPQLLVEVFIDRVNHRCYSFQLYANSGAILRHWQVSDPHITEVMRYCTVQSLEVYGSPSEAVRDGMLRAVGREKITFVPSLVGFHRLGQSGGDA